MTVGEPSGRALRLSVREISIRGVSGSEARRLADALPHALERALARLDAPPVTGRARTPADAAAAQIAQAVRERLGRAS